MLLAGPVAAQGADPVAAPPVEAPAAEAPAEAPVGEAPAAEVPAPIVGACDASEAAELRAHLEAERRRARKWNFAWAGIFGAASISTLAFGLSGQVPDLETGLYVSSGKAGIGALARLILPLRIPVPDPLPDPCAEVASLRKALALAAKRERQNFFLNHIGGILVNGGGALIIWKYQSGGQALLSVAIGYPIGLLSNYTGPRRSWHRYRERTWSVGVAPTQTGWLVGAGGTF